MKSNFTPREHPLFPKAFRAYIQYVNSGLYFRKEHVLGLELQSLSWLIIRTALTIRCAYVYSSLTGA